MSQPGNTAGTVVAAVLENAGYLSQQSLLKNFGWFWDSWGVLIFVLICIYALSIFVLTGRYDRAVYIVFGPVLFYFLIYTTSEIPLVKFKLGDGEAKRTITTGPDAPPETARVSTVFAVFTKLTSNLVSTLNEFILENADDEHFLFSNRAKALQALTTSDPASAELVQMMGEPFLTVCSPFISASIHLASHDFDGDYQKELAAMSASSPAAAKTLEFLTYQFDYWTQVIETADEVQVKINPAMRAFMGRWGNIPLPQGGIDYAKQFGKLYPGDRVNFIEKELPNLNLNCAEAVQVLGDAALKQGDWLEKFVVEGTLDASMRSKIEDRDAICKAMARKIKANYNEMEPCNLGSFTAMFILRRMFSESSLSFASQKLVNRSTVYRGSVANLCDPEQKDEGDESFCRTWDVEQPTPPLSRVSEKAAEQAVGILKSVMSYAYDIPYFQGLLLFLIAAFFPFAAMLVLIPGKAPGVVTVLMLWLWVKSWDAGFALVYLLDKFLYELLPPINLDAPGRPTIGELPDLLRQAAGTDLNADILAHYHFIGFAMMSVPAITGMLITRAASGLSVILNEVSNRSAYFSLEQSSASDPIAKLMKELGNSGGANGAAPANNTPAKTAAAAPATPKK